MKFSKEAKIGLIMLVGIALLFWGVNFLKGRDFFSSEKKVFAIYDQVDGLAASNPVLVNGLKVGLIQHLSLLDDNTGRILVSMHITNKVHIPRRSIAQIFSVDILGSKGIRIIMSDDKDELQDGDTLQPGIQKSLPEEVSSQVAPLKEKAESLISSMDSVLYVIRDVFNSRTKNNLKRSFESISNSLASIEHIAGSMDTVLSKEGRLRTIFDNLESISTNLKNNNKKISTMIENFSAISDTLARSNLSKTLDNLQTTLNQTASLMEKVNKGEGTIGQLATNDSLYHNLNSTARDLDLLLNDLKNNPGKICEGFGDFVWKQKMTGPLITMIIMIAMIRLLNVISFKLIFNTGRLFFLISCFGLNACAQTPIQKENNSIAIILKVVGDEKSVSDIMLYNHTLLSERVKSREEKYAGNNPLHIVIQNDQGATMFDSYFENPLAKNLESFGKDGVIEKVVAPKHEDYINVRFKFPSEENQLTINCYEVRKEQEEKVISRLYLKLR